MDRAFQPTDLSERPSPTHALYIRTYRDGEMIVGEGEEIASLFFVILSGQVRLIRHGRKVLILGPEDIFGLETIILKKRSLYTARALNESRIATYGPEALDHFLLNNAPMTERIVASILRQLLQSTQNMANLDEDVVRRINIDEIQDIRFYRDNDNIIEEGTKGTDFYRLISSENGLRVTLKGKEISRIQQPGEFFGEMASLLHMPRQATVSSVGESVVEVYSADKLDVIVRDYPEMAIQLIRTLAFRLAEANRKLAEDDSP